MGPISVKSPTCGKRRQQSCEGHGDSPGFGQRGSKERRGLGCGILGWPYVRPPCSCTAAGVHPPAWRTKLLGLAAQDFCPASQDQPAESGTVPAKNGTSGHSSPGGQRQHAPASSSFYSPPHPKTDGAGLQPSSAPGLTPEAFLCPAAPHLVDLGHHRIHHLAFKGPEDDGLVLDGVEHEAAARLDDACPDVVDGGDGDDEAVPAREGTGRGGTTPVSLGH